MIVGTGTSQPVYSRQINLLSRPAAASLVLYMAAVASLSAADSVLLSLGDLAGPDWRVSGIQIALDLQAESDQYRIRVAEISHPALPETIKSFEYHCRSGAVTAHSVVCHDGRASLQIGQQKQRNLKTRINWNISSHSIDIKANNIALSGGTIAADLRLREAHWTLAVDARQIDISQLGTHISGLQGPISAFSLAGQSDLRATLKGQGNQLISASAEADYQGLRFSDQPGDYLAEGLTGHWQGQVTVGRQTWHGKQQLNLASGEMLTPHFYLAASGKPLEVATRFDYRPQQALLRLQEMHLDHQGAFRLEGAAELAIARGLQLKALTLASPPSSLSHLFQAYLLPVLPQPFLQRLKLDGGIALELSYTEERADLAVVLHDASITQSGEDLQQLALEGIAADLHWSSTSAAESRISWKAGRLFNGITLGPTSFRLLFADNRLSLPEGVSLDILDGTLRAEQFELEQGKKGPRVKFQGYLTPISMQAISQALDWPLLSGQLSGMIPAVSYENGLIAVDGVALVKLFGGEILIRNLMLDDLFGVLPALTADLELKNIDLETLTRTFSFGKITGKLAGRVDALRMEDWVPVSFNARFATPEDDDTRHRINQKAVDNISNLGGSGVSGAISRSFLRFFEDFGYARLGISCRLHQGVCHMDGIEQAEQGYYLVKGGGIPRIDIIGFNRRTDWAVLVNKLQQIASGGSPVIE